MIRHTKSAVSTLTLCLTIAAVFSHAAFAADGGSDVGGGSDGCGSYWNTCNGASWRYYTTTEDSVFIKSGNGTPCYVDANGNITSGPKCTAPGGYITGCAAVGGYWRYAWEGVAPVAGQHVGLIPIGGGGNPSYRSAMFIGGANAYWPNTHGADVSSPEQKAAKIASGASGFTGEWDFVHKEYNDAINRGDTPNVGTWDENSPLAWFCSAPTANGGEFASRSNVRIGDGAGYETSDWIDKATGNAIGTVGSGATVSVTFSHDMKYSGTLPNNSVEVKKDWTYQLGVTGATVQMTPSSAISPTTGKNPYVPANNDVQQVWQSHSYSVTMPTVTTGTQSVTICERITYQNKKLDGTTWTGGESFSRACAVITVSAQPTGPVVSECPLPDSSYSIQYGGTQARSGVVNLTKDGTWKYTDGTTSTAAFVWAKPSDTIKFQHTLCFGAQNVRGSKDNGSSDAPPSDDVKPTIANTATITALTAPATSGGKYLFGNTLNGGSTQTFTVSPGSATASSGTPDEKGNYWFTYYSPSNNSASTYSCYATGSAFLPFKTNGYQIPDFASTAVPANCNSAKKASTSSDAGKVIEQNLTWNNVKAWQNTHNTAAGGSCNCSVRDAYADNTTHSYEDMKNGTYSAGTRVRKCYTAASTGCGWCGRSPSYGTYDYKYYPIDTSSDQGTKQIAQVKVPFNYATKTNVSTGQDILYDGGEYNVNVTIDINKRPNTDVSTTDYATITKNSVYEVVAFTVAPNTGFGAIAHANDEYSGASSKQACSYYSQGASKCLSVLRSGTMQLNDKGNLNGSVENVFSGDLAVPDAEVGTKFCVAVGVWPSDSHNYTTGPAGTDDTALDINDGDFWNYSEPTCRTVTKKPTVQFRSAGAYTTGGITTSQTKKSVSYNFGDFGSGNSLQSGIVNHGSRQVFGSFTEYETIAKNYISGFASGAGFGYGSNNGGDLNGSIALPGGYPNVLFTTEADPCTYSTQTFSNDKCSDKVTGASSINSLGTTILNRLIARYTDSTSAVTQNSSTIDFNTYKTLENQAKYIKINGDATISASYCMNKGNSADSNTFVIDVSGTLTISGNIKYGSGTGNNCNNENYTNIAELPQMLIFANGINITSGVSQIDAWLISGQKGGSNSSINTCSDLSSSRIGNGYTVPKQTNYVPCDSQLYVNGPVYAKELILNRNAGAGVGNASIEAAEIFNLRPDTYLWAFNQASRFSQAVTTYQRELSPRY